MRVTIFHRGKEREPWGQVWLDENGKIQADRQVAWLIEPDVPFKVFVDGRMLGPHEDPQAWIAALPTFLNAEVVTP